MLTGKVEDNSNGNNNRIRPELGKSVIELPNNLRLRILRNQEISGVWFWEVVDGFGCLQQVFCDLQFQQPQ